MDVGMFEVNRLRHHLTMITIKDGTHMICRVVLKKLPEKIIYTALPW